MSRCAMRSSEKKSIRRIARMITSRRIARRRKRIYSRKDVRNEDNKEQYRVSNEEEHNSVHEGGKLWLF